MEKDITLIDFLNAYNECWYNKDLEKLKEFHDYENNVLIYFIIIEIMILTLLKSI